MAAKINFLSARDAGVVPAQDTDLEPQPGAIYVGVTGNLAVKTAEGNNATFKNVPAGSVIAIRALQVLSTTTAGDLVLMYE